VNAPLGAAALDQAEKLALKAAELAQKEQEMKLRAFKIAESTRLTKLAADENVVKAKIAADENAKTRN